MYISQLLTVKRRRVMLSAGLVGDAAREISSELRSAATADFWCSPDAVSFPHHTRLLRERLQQALTSLLQTISALVGMHAYPHVENAGLLRACLPSGRGEGGQRAQIPNIEGGLLTH